MGRTATPIRWPCISCMLLAVALMLAAAARPAAASDRRPLDITRALTASADIAALSVNKSGAAVITDPVTEAGFAAGLVQAARVATNARSEWDAADLGAQIPAFTRIGCFRDGTNFQAARRLARRLAVTRGMTVNQCAKRADAFGYSLFGITWYEDAPSRGFACWGAWDQTFARALGSAGTRCRQPCAFTRGTRPSCGAAFTFNLYQITGRPASDITVRGQWHTMLELPIAGVHSMQVTGRDEFLLIDFLMGTHPTSWNSTYNVVRWNRNSNTWSAVQWFQNNRRDAACGMLVRMPDGELASFSGHYGTTEYGNSFARDFRGINMYHRHRNDVESVSTSLPWGRWYGGSVLLPTGRVYVVGGQDDFGQDNFSDGGVRANGAEIWDPATRSLMGRTSTTAPGNNPAYPVNTALFTASRVGGYYPGLVGMPDGSMLFAQTTEVQTINVVTGATIGRTPPLPLQVTWEWPQAAPVQFLQMEPYTPGQAWSVDWIVFGGNWQSTIYTPGRDFSLRIRLTISASGVHTFGAWQVETMPGPRVQHDCVMLPNGKVIILNGGETGLGGLQITPPTTNYHIDEPWVYDPDAAVGQRYSRTAAYTNIFRAYHGNAVLTSFGDILVAGTAIGRGFRQYTRRPYSITQWPLSEYRIELFTPHYILNKPRPAWAWTPTVVNYGEGFSVSLASNTTSESIKSVVLVDGGSTTHSSNMANRNQKLSFRRDTANQLWVQAPANTFVAPPTFYQLFLVANDDSYSTGAWVQLRPPFSEPPATLRTTATSAVPQASSRFEPSLGQSTSPFQVVAGTATLAIESAAVGSLVNGLTILPTTSSVTIASDSFTVASGARIHMHLWARTSAANVHLTMSLGDSAGSAVSAGLWVPAVQLSGLVTATYQNFPLGGLIPGGGTYTVLLTFTGLTPGVPVQLDDVETWAIGVTAGPTTPVAAAAAAAAAGTTTAPSSSWMGDDNMTPKGRPDVPLPPSVQGNPMQGVPQENPMDAMREVMQKIRDQLPGFTVTASRRAPTFAEPGVAP